MSKNSYKSCALIMSATVILALISMLPLGIFGAVIMALLASTIGYTVTKHLYHFVAVICALVLLIYSLFSKDFLLAITVSLPTILSGITLGIAYNTKLSQFKITGIITSLYTVYLLLNIKLSNINFAEIFKTLAKTYSEVLSSVYNNQIAKAELDSQIAELMSVTMKFMPSFVIILCACFALLLLYAFKKVLKITKSDISFFEPFSEWHTDKSFCIAFLVIIVISFVLPEKSYISDALANVVLVSEFVFYIFGLSLISFLLKPKMKKSLLRKTILILLVPFCFGTPLFIICCLGVLDGFFNFRTKLSKNNLPK